MGNQILSLERRIWIAGVLTVAGVAVAWFMGYASMRVLLGAACGAAIVCVNFFMVRKILTKAFLENAEINKWFAVQYVIRFLVVAAILFLIVWSGWFDVLGLLIGLTTLFFGIILEVIYRLFRPAY